MVSLLGGWNDGRVHSKAGLENYLSADYHSWNSAPGSPSWRGFVSYLKSKIIFWFGQNLIATRRIVILSVAELDKKNRIRRKLMVIFEPCNRTKIRPNKRFKCHTHRSERPEDFESPLRHSCGKSASWNDTKCEMPLKQATETSFCSNMRFQHGF